MKIHTKLTMIMAFAFIRLRQNIPQLSPWKSLDEARVLRWMKMAWTNLAVVRHSERRRIVAGFGGMNLLSAYSMILLSLLWGGFIFIGLQINQGYAEGENSKTNSPPKVETKTEKPDPYVGMDPKDKALFQALQKNDLTTVLEDVKVAIENGANVNACATRQLTPLMVAIRTGPEVVKYLLEKGADVKAKDSAGNTALVFAKKKNNEEAVKLLQDAGAME